MALNLGGEKRERDLHVLCTRNVVILGVRPLGERPDGFLPAGRQPGLPEVQTGGCGTGTAVSWARRWVGMRVK